MGRRRQVKFLLMMCMSPLLLMMYKHMYGSRAVGVSVIQQPRDTGVDTPLQTSEVGPNELADTMRDNYRRDDKNVRTTLKVLSEINRDVTDSPNQSDSRDKTSLSHEGSNQEHTDESPEYRPNADEWSRRDDNRYGFRGEHVVFWRKHPNGTVQEVDPELPRHRPKLHYHHHSQFINWTHPRDNPPGIRGRPSLMGLTNQNLSTKARIAEWRKFEAHQRHRAATKAIRWDDDWLENFANKGMIDLMDLTIVGQGVVPIRLKEFVLKPKITVEILETLTSKLKKELDRMDRMHPTKPVSYDRRNLPVELYKLAPYMLDKLPTTFSPRTKSPCWKDPEMNFPIMCLPYFYLIGAPKSATTDLWSKILLHPDAVRPRDKEPQFWTRGNLLHGLTKYCYNLLYLSKAVIRDDRSYSSYISGDGTASNFWERRRSLLLYGQRPDGPPYFTADLLRAIQPGAKIIIIIREPTSRLYSEYLDLDAFWPLFKSPEDFHVRVENVIGHFNKCLETTHVAGCAANYYQPRIQVGMYSVHVREWMKRFPASQVLILKTENWGEDPGRELKKAYSFLNLTKVPDKVIESFTKKERKNQRKPKNRRVGDMLPVTRELLDKFYQPFEDDLARFLKNEDFLWRKKVT